MCAETITAAHYGHGSRVAPTSVRSPAPEIAAIAICLVVTSPFVIRAAEQDAARAIEDARIEGDAWTIDATRVVRKVSPGAVGWGAMWKRATLWPAPPDDFTDDSHVQYLRRLAHANRPLMREADVRHVSWPWGVSFSTWGVNWENSVGPWSKRSTDCGPHSGWCEKSIVGVGDLMMLAEAWELEAVTVSVPLAVFDGDRRRWGWSLVTNTFSDETSARIADHARRLILFMQSRPEWRRLERVYLAVGCEWRQYVPQIPPENVLSYARVVKAVRNAIRDPKVVVVACASDSADLGGFKDRLQSVYWNKTLYEQLAGEPGVVVDLHRYRGMIGLQADNGRTPMTPANTELLLRTGLSQRGFLTVDPRQWGARGEPLGAVLLENAIHGVDGAGRKTLAMPPPRPWAATMAHADLVREALNSSAQAFLGWTWFPERFPAEWTHGAIHEGKLEPHALAQAFLTRCHRGDVLAVEQHSASPVRGGAARTNDGIVRIYGGNFSRQPRRLRLNFRGTAPRMVRAELMTDGAAIQSINVDLDRPFVLPPMSLWRVALAPSPAAAH